MTTEANKQVRPLFLAKPGSMSRKDIARAERLCGICIVECDDPEACRFMEPPPSANIEDQARAALALVRTILDQSGSDVMTYKRSDLMTWYLRRLFGPKPPEVKKVKP